jgi:biofilm PGA synthesis protein PgaA
MKSALRRWIAVLAIPLAGLAAAEPAFAQTATAQREAAVLMARSGQVPEALAALRAMLAAGIDDGLVAMDLASLLQQDGRAADAVAVFEKAALPDPPEYALLAATRAYRDVKNAAAAERLARQGLQRFPQGPNWPLILSLVLSDAGRTDEALAFLAEPTALRAPPVERLMAEAHAWQRAGDPFKALHLYTEAIRVAPDNAEPKREAAGILADLNGPYGAADLAGTSLPNAAQQAGALVRYGEIPVSDPARRFDATDAALARLDALLADLPGTEADLRRRVRLDRMVALRDRVRMDEAKTEGDALRTDAPLPAFAESAYADALLYLKQPGPSREAYERVLAESPDDVQARYGVFYASVELEDYEAAYTAIDTLVNAEPLWRTYRNDPSRYANPERASAEVTAAAARYYGNQLGEAWARITRVTAAAPALANARIATSQISAARGWPMRAEAEAQIAASLAPRRVDTQIALAETAAANQRLTDADRIAADLAAQYPENLAVGRLVRDLDAARRWQFGLDGEPSNSDGGGANASGEAVTIDSRLNSPPIADHWRFFVLSGYSDAHPPEGFVSRGRAGAGVEWRSARLTASLFPTASWGTLSKRGVGATMDWLITDQIQFAIAAERFTKDTPLRALLQGITSTDYATRATYRWHESRSVSANAVYQPFSDDNQRLAGGVTFRQMVVNQPRINMTAVADAYASRNTRLDAPYYNPARDLSATGGAVMEHLMWRRYDMSLAQALTVDAGLYAQRDYSNSWVGTLRYEHRWRIDPLTSFYYGVGLSRRVYDGVPERTLTFTAGLGQRF